MNCPKKNKPKLLFIGPVWPAETGNGLAMRAGSLVRALHEKYAISLLVLASNDFNKDLMDTEIQNLCDACQSFLIPKSEPKRGRVMKKIFGPLPEMWDGATKPFLKRINAQYDTQNFDVVFVFRFYLFPYVRKFLKNATKAVLDLDELDSQAFFRMADIYQRNGRLPKSNWLTRQAKAILVQERKHLASFHSISVSSEKEKSTLTQLIGNHSIVVVPNIAVQKDSLKLEEAKEVFRFLFIGSFAHYPNVDAVMYFCSEILPQIERRTNRRLAIDILGRSSLILKDFLSNYPTVSLHGQVDDLSQYYKHCHAVIVPLRAAGGTRIKILEAFQYGRPVVSTVIGVEGLTCEHNQELLIAEDESEFIECCLRLIDEPELREKLASAGKEYVEQHHSSAIVRQRLLEMLL